jgi:uncharacterized damage-inducible protein DinB
MSDAQAGFNPAHLYEYLANARIKLLGWVRPLTLEQYTKEFSIGKKTLRDTLVHTAASEWSYIRRIREEPIAQKSQEDHPFWKYYQTGFAPLEAAWRELTEDTRRTLRRITDWSKPVEYTTIDSKFRIRAVTGGIAGQLLFHEMHHRAQAMAMLRQLGVPAENLDYSILAYERTELPVSR